MPTSNQESECSTSSVTSFNTSTIDFYEAKVTELNLVHCVYKRKNHCGINQFDLFHDGVTQTFFIVGIG